MQPDSYNISLMADYESKCEFATFLWTGDILLKMYNRYMVFDVDGTFVTQAEFHQFEDSINQSSINKSRRNKTNRSISRYMEGGEETSKYGRTRTHFEETYNGSPANLLEDYLSDEDSSL